MPSKCQLTGKKLIVGHKVSHSQVKTKRAYKVNVQNFSVASESLKKSLSLSIAVSTLRTIEHNGGLDNFLLNTSNRKLTDEAIRIKKQIQKALEGSKTTANSNEKTEKKAEQEAA